MTVQPNLLKHLTMRDRLNMEHESLISLLSIAGRIAISLTLLLTTPVLAQQQSPLITTVTLKPKFAPDPLQIRGISGGSVKAKTIAGRAETATGPCTGFVDMNPDHTFVLTTFFNYLSIQVQSPEDTTLVIQGPGGSWCNDDYEAKNPGIAGQWLAGTYKVWIGSYDKTKYLPYILTITELR